MSSDSFTRIVLRERPETEILPEITFESQAVSKNALKAGAGEVVVQVIYVSLDPAMRWWLREARSYIPPVQIGEVMRSVALGVVVEVGEGSTFTKGDIVHGMLGWTEFAVFKDAELQKITPPPGTNVLDFLGILGMTGMTAYFGLYHIGKPKAGETLVVSGAAGAVGSIVCQLGKRAGAKVVAIAGTDDKCAWLRNELGADMALNYKHGTFKEEFTKAVDGIDVHFDNVGGEILDLALDHLNQGARIALCGGISAYNSPPSAHGLKNYLNVIVQRAKIEGFLVLDYTEQFPKAVAHLAAGLIDGTIKQKFHVIDGLENAPKALSMLFTGENNGKLVVHVSGDRF